MSMGRESITSCMIRQRPASAMYPVFCRPIDHEDWSIRRLVLRKATGRRPASTVSPGAVEYWRISGYS